MFDRKDRFMNTKQVFIVGFMLFAMFFGAGNLIFPPALGFEAGDHFWLAILGFALTGVGLPLLSMIVGSISEGGYRESLKHIHPFFSIGLLMVIYLTIGPFFAIPRTATTAYEMGIVPFLSSPSDITLFLFTIGFFALVLWIALSPADLSDTIGKFLTPTLLVTIIALIVRAFFLYFSNEPQMVHPTFNADAPFATGFLEGYLTMDAIAAIAFSIVVLNSIRSMGFNNRRELLVGTTKSAFLAAALLVFIYGSLGWIGNRVDLGAADVGNQNLGTFLLLFVSNEVFGGLGVFLLGVIVFLACLTTATGLIASVAEYFNSLFPKVSYKSFAGIFTFISLVLANQGLDQVIQTSVPVLSILYPIAMTTVFLLVFTFFVPSPGASLRVPVFAVTVLSFLAMIHRSGWMAMDWLESLPLFASQLEWIPVMVIGYVIGFLFGFNREKIRYS